MVSDKGNKKKGLTPAEKKKRDRKASRKVLSNQKLNPNNNKVIYAIIL